MALLSVVHKCNGTWVFSTEVECLLYSSLEKTWKCEGSSGGLGHRHSWRHEAACSIIYLPWLSSFCLVSAPYFECFCGHIITRLENFLCENTLKETFCLDWSHQIGVLVQFDWQFGHGNVQWLFKQPRWCVHKYALDLLKLNTFKQS